MKFIKGDIIIDAQYEFTHNIFLRDGFVPLTEEPVEKPVETTEENPIKTTEEETLEKLRAKAKELGIKNAHSMKEETLRKKIAEL
jgi:hypothetical protein